MLPRHTPPLKGRNGLAPDVRSARIKVHSFGTKGPEARKKPCLLSLFIIALAPFHCPHGGPVFPCWEDPTNWRRGPGFDPCNSVAEVTLVLAHRRRCICIAESAACGRRLPFPGKGFRRALTGGTICCMGSVYSSLRCRRLATLLNAQQSTERKEAWFPRTPSTTVRSGR
ncbi:hypothetical protein NDU88_008042 [Pleurodeles waltl]|uniref:Uncharacterized protein n=1 Tax=Pleurodeles waltl TaxID=8319 RepID=A0AAV7VU14_PLEWA|nr:hypothetical protein NDU88_008042 [Pleurodeles waltl]